MYVLCVLTEHTNRQTSQRLNGTRLRSIMYQNFVNLNENNKEYIAKKEFC